MSVVQVGEIVAIMLMPSMIVGTLLYLPRTVRAVRRRVARRRQGDIADIGDLHPTNPPIEHLAVELRWLLGRHEMLSRSPDAATKSRQLWALEGAIAHCATATARALELACPDWPAYNPLPRTELRRLLRALAGRRSGAARGQQPAGVGPGQLTPPAPRR